MNEAKPRSFRSEVFDVPCSAPWFADSRVPGGLDSLRAPLDRVYIRETRARKDSLPNDLDQQAFFGNAPVFMVMPRKHLSAEDVIPALLANCAMGFIRIFLNFCC